MNISKLYEKISAAAPIHGVSIGSETDKTTWRIDFKDNATESQKQAAQTIIDNWTDTPEPVYIPIEIVMERLGDKADEIWQSLTVAQQIRFIRLQDGIAIDDAEVRALLAAHEIDPDEILKQEI